LWRLIGEQWKIGTDDYPWKLSPIPTHSASLAIQAVKSNENAAVILQGLCDMYVLERDNLTYHVVYPAALGFLLPGATSPKRAAAFAKCLLEDDILGTLRLDAQCAVFDQ
jgi:hypothetical protein